MIQSLSWDVAKHKKQPDDGHVHRVNWQDIPQIHISYTSTAPFYATGMCQWCGLELVGKWPNVRKSPYALEPDDSKWDPANAKYFKLRGGRLSDMIPSALIEFDEVGYA